MIKVFFTIGLLCLFVSPAQLIAQVDAQSDSALQESAKSETKPLLSETQKSKLGSGYHVRASSLKPAIRSPMISDFDRPSGQESILLDEEMKQHFVFEISNTKLIDDKSRFKNCQYRPGVEFIIFRDSKLDTDKAPGMDAPNDTGLVWEFKVLLCFNCNVWAVINEEGQLNFGDISERTKMRSIVGKLFGDDFFFQ